MVIRLAHRNSFSFVIFLSAFWLSTLHVLALVSNGENRALSFSTLQSATFDPTCLEKGANQLPRTSILLKIGYDGSHYFGWSAANKSQRTVEGELKKKLAKIFGNLDPECVIVEGCSRTDKGVHAQGMVAQAYAITPSALDATRVGLCPYYPGQPSIPGKRYPHPWNNTDSTECFVPILATASKIGFALNRMSGVDLRIFAVAPSPTRSRDDVPFHPTLHARLKTYQYTISTGTIADPIRRKRVWHVGKVVDDLFLDRMQDAARLLQGAHDFTAFSPIPKGPQDRKRRKESDFNGTCDLASIQIAPTDYRWRDTREITITITGNRFLYKMARMLVGTFVAVGMGAMTPSQIQSALVYGERLPTHIVECAPPHGLVLQHVDLDARIEWEPVNS
ncbi:hypothetical protein FisN_28Hh103 [Fistulifera solaris]|uniref:tRNA pseudouridine synthase n=1 Tax=Fistulifera solaris TaxID=1519565 RepID=A0A1Z5KH40_FISSO|nr:hypothetical protein FisN_28Hh103 [Fistulifera solaris]|eukprot:GAX25623.1 hypothetical protein FisN_28Hh103 [Fistulifera solaris]